MATSDSEDTRGVLPDAKGANVADHDDLGAAAKAIVDANRYLVLGTADETGLPWVSPVWYATEDYRSFFWVSSPDARHSRNLAVRKQVGIVIFDSQMPVGAAQAVYLAAEAEQLAGQELEQGIALFSRRSEAQRLRAWTPAEVLEPAPLRLYCARASEQFVLGAGDERLPVLVA
jgi:nitroimidazol reductase NimA-like FMN-containing flavoprotein (pyridoxamine 5'-phosphate oxidase superfamily)